MVAAYWQQPLLQADVARWLGTRGIGTPSSRIQRLAKRGFKVTYGTGSLAELESWIAQGVPCILFVRTGELPYWQIDTPHAIVLAGLEANHAYLVDPAVETVLVTVSLGDLMLAWSYSEYTYAVLHVSV
jgi:ABC-type bacteriocin/lantibiotic exporter with double-glycine peptidase domain